MAIRNRDRNPDNLSCLLIHLEITVLKPVVNNIKGFPDDFLVASIKLSLVIITEISNCFSPPRLFTPMLNCRKTNPYKGCCLGEIATSEPRKDSLSLLCLRP